MTESEQSFNPKNALPVLLALTAIAIMAIFPVQNYDIFWHLANGKVMVTEGRILNEEVLSYTQNGTQYHNHEWLSQVLLYMVYSKAGINGLLVFKVMILCLLYFFLYKTVRLFDLSRVEGSILVFFASCTGFYRFIVRPHLFSLLFLAIMVYLLTAVHRRRLRWQWLLLIPPVIWGWGHLHVPHYGLILLGAFVAGETLVALLFGTGLLKGPDTTSCKPYVIRLIAVAFLSLIAPMLTSHGFEVYRTFFSYLFPKTSNLMNVVFEFKQTPFKAFEPFWVYLSLLVLLAIAFFRKANITFLFIAVPFIIAAVKYNRATALFSIAAFPALAYYISLLAKQLGDLKPVARKTVFVFLLVPFLIYMINIKFYSPDNVRGFKAGILKNNYPVSAANFIKQSGINGSMFNDGHMGGYLAYELWPEKKIFLYNHYLIFNDLYFDIYNKEFLTKYDISYAITNDRAFMNIMFSPGEWEPVYWDDNVAVVLKNRVENINVLDKYRLRYYTPWITRQQLFEIAKDPSQKISLLREISHCLTFGPNERGAHDLAALILQNTRQLPLKETMRLIEQARKSNPENAALLVASAQISYFQKNFDQAIRSLHESFRYDDNNSHAYSLLAYIHMDRQEYALAERGFTRAIKINNRNAVALYGLALTHKALGKTELARKDIERLLDAYPSEPWASKANGFLKTLEK